MVEGATGEYVDVILQVAARDPSIARVLREICALDGPTRATALGLVAAHLRTRRAPQDVLDCIAMLRQDAVARRIAEVLRGEPGSGGEPSGEMTEVLPPTSAD
jgi:hypothetical protein